MLEVVEFLVILAILLLILVDLSLNLFRMKRYTDMIMILEESLNRKGALQQIGLGFWKGFNNSIAGSNKIKMQQTAFLRKLTTAFVPKDLYGWLPDDYKNEIEENPFLIPAVLRFVKAYREAGLSGLGKEFSDMVGQQQSGLGDIMKMVTQKVFKQESEEQQNNKNQEVK